MLELLQASTSPKNQHTTSQSFCHQLVINKSGSGTLRCSFSTWCHRDHNGGPELVVGRWIYLASGIDYRLGRTWSLPSMNWIWKCETNGYKGRLSCMICQMKEILKRREHSDGVCLNSSLKSSQMSCRNSTYVVRRGSEACYVVF